MIVIEERKVCRMLEGLFQFDKECEWNDAIEEAMHRFVNLPTIEAEPVRHGRWLRGSAYPHHIFCSVCYATYIPNDEIPLWKSESYFNVPRNYCPYCGAKMDGGGEDG